MIQAATIAKTIPNLRNNIFSKPPEAPILHQTTFPTLPTTLPNDSF